MTKSNIKNIINKIQSPPIKWALGFNIVILTNAILVVIFHYFSFRSLWLDESFIAVNLKGPLSGLYNTFSYSQQFPRIYLSLVWFLKSGLGYEVWVLRLLPFLFGLSAIVLWGKILWDEFSNTKVMSIYLVICATLLFFNNHEFFNYAPDFKQYSADIFFSGWAYWWGKEFIDKGMDKKIHVWLLLCLGWTFPILLSFTYSLVLFSVGCFIFLPYLCHLKKTPIIKFVIFLLLGFSFLGASYAIDLRHTHAAYNQYWGQWFIKGTSVSEWLISAKGGILNFYGEWWSNKATIPFTILGLFGLGFLFLRVIRKKPISLLLKSSGLLFILVFTLAALKEYPLTSGRLGLFFFPYSVASIVYGIHLLLSSRFRVIKLGGVLAIAAVFTVIFVKSGPGIINRFYFGTHWEDLNPAIKSLNKEVSTKVVYGDGTHVQVAAFPHLPPEFTFIHQKEFMDQLYKNKSDRKSIPTSVYYLTATPSGSLGRFERALNQHFAFDLKEIVDHLNLFQIKQKTN